MSARSLIALEAGVVESKTISGIAIVEEFHKTLQFVIKLSEKRIREEMSLEIDDNKVDRKERQLLLLKQAQLVDFFKAEIETCEMAMEDARMRAIGNDLKGQRMSSKFTHYLQEQETLLTDFSTKIMERALTFAKRLVLEVTEWTSMPLDHKEKNKFMWTLQLAFADIIGTLDTGDEEYASKLQLGNLLANEVNELRHMDSIADEEKTHMSRNDLPDLLHLFKMLQLAEIVCKSSTINRGGGAGTTPEDVDNLLKTTYPTIHETARLVGRSMSILPYFLKPDDDKVYVFIKQCLSSLRALLGTPHAIKRFDKPIPERKENDNKPGGVQGGAVNALRNKTPSKKAPTALALSAWGTPIPDEKKPLPPPTPVWSWGTSKFNEILLAKALVYWSRLAVDCRLNHNKLLAVVLSNPGYDPQPLTKRNTRGRSPGSPGNRPGSPGQEIETGLGEGSTVSFADDGMGMPGPLGEVSMLGESLAESSFGYMAPKQDGINYTFSATGGPQDMGLDGFEDEGEGEYGSGNGADVFGYQNKFQHFQVLRLMYDRIDASGLFTIGSQTICDLLRCCQATISSHTAAPKDEPREAPIVIEPKSPVPGAKKSGAVTSTPAYVTPNKPSAPLPPVPVKPALPDHFKDRTMINAASKLALVVLQQYAFEMTNARGYNFDDARFLQDVDEEAIHAIKIATTIYQANICNYSTLDISTISLNVTLLRPSNYFLCITALQCIYSCCLAYLHGALFCEDDLGNRHLSREEAHAEAYATKNRKDIPSVKDPLIRILYREQLLNNKTVLLILKIMGTHPTSLTLQHVGLQIIRMLVRKPFATKVEIQDLFEEKDDQNEEVEEEEPLEGDNAEDMQSAVTARELYTWHTQVWDYRIKDMGDGEATTAVLHENWSLITCMLYCGDNHSQSYEIVEQILLLVQHLGMVSYLCRVTLLERGIDKLLNRVIEVSPHDIYLMALVSACQETLARTD